LGLSTLLKIVDFDYDRYPALKRWIGRMLSLPEVQAAHAEFFSQFGVLKKLVLLKSKALKANVSLKSWRYFNQLPILLQSQSKELLYC
jgi:hypothetical protein